MNPAQIISRKRDREPLSDEEIRFFIQGFTDGTIPDYQMSALLMAIVLNGLSKAELVAWTDAMLHSGDVVDLSHVPVPKVDKHWWTGPSNSLMPCGRNQSKGTVSQTTSGFLA